MARKNVQRHSLKSRSERKMRQTRTSRRLDKLLISEIASSSKVLFYGPTIDDS
ncbi:hypothetical protein WH47_01654 [Habropoda laboriosa]|uniref:Uncharacterized protein n=1 Tax=Habropoda laboriosa TaxID=597456 RepID=A0A0L7R465_9HYME|nr:hypothetical protein WH47_01654 [Habropoda laboriosa]